MTSPTPPILILGATSLVGRRLPPLPGAVALSRTPREGRGLRWIVGDLAAGDLGDTGPIATVLSLSPIWLLPPVLDALADRGMRRLVAFSSTSVVGKAASPDPKEQAVVRALADGEAAVRAIGQARGVAWTLLRPTLIYDEGHDGNVSRLAGLIRRFGVLPISGAGAGLRQPVHAQDLAQAALAAAVSPEAQGKSYDLPGGETLTYRAMAGRVFEGLGKRPRVIGVPPALFGLALKAASPLLPGATAAMGRRMDEDLAFDGSAAARDFGWAPRGFRPRF